MKQKAVLVLLLLLICSLLFSACDDIITIEGYTGVLEDLGKALNFDVSEYVKKLGDYSLQVIQIGESDHGELFLYVYQPSGKVQATSVNIAQEKDPKTEDTHNLTLKLLNSSGILYKYLVEGLTVRNTTTRYYDITSIYRAWDKDIDDEPGNGNVINEVVYEVGQLWIAEDTSDGVSYSVQGVETIEILNPYTNHLTYNEGFFGNTNVNTDSHYLAFDTDKRMDDLLEASISYNIRSAYSLYWTTYGEWDPVEKTITKDDVVESADGPVWLFADDYKFSRIVKTEDFVATETLSDTAKAEVEKTKWVLRFCETTRSYSGSSAGASVTWKDVSDVTLLRLKFQTDGVVYNMGTVMNKISLPLENELDLPWWVIALIVLAILLVIGLIVKPVATAIVWIVKIVWYIISAPFKFIAWLFSKGGKQ